MRGRTDEEEEMLAEQRAEESEYVYPVFGWLCLQGWDGFSKTRVEVIGQTPKRLRIRAIERTRLGGRNRWLNPGEEALVPITAVRDNCARCNGTRGGMPGNENLIDGIVTCDNCHAGLMSAGK